MEIEFQNDYTVNTCVYKPPAFFMVKPKVENPCVGLAYNGYQYMVGILGVPYPTYLEVTVSSENGILRFINKSIVSKILTIGFDISMPIFPYVCSVNNLTDAIEITESSPLGKPFPQVNNISFIMYPTIPYSIFSSNLLLVNGKITFFNYVDA